ncbi:MAG: nicotinate (nicotinamide) nucleotide adenylyltransferase [Cytophagaceae bacterium]|nr:nicotinate (nicotinamide) nucleotide adenylyltransferase [Cytophagaceae bacterium]MDW8456921.1 nicotinate (nicotinamide) nucleotide adenylyltransferase [Cytophagaceae bacterium]
MKVGLFFGSFNPIHIGHLIIANYMACNTDLDEVWFIVSPQNPFKKSSSLLHEFDRYEMIRLAIHDNFKLKVSDIEFRLPKPSYTIDTLTYIQDIHKQKEFVLILGEDNLSQFPNWKNYEKILEYYCLYVYPRPRSDKSSLIHHPKIKMVNAPLLDISATHIRQLVKENKSIRYLVTEDVERYIERNQFFK